MRYFLASLACAIALAALPAPAQVPQLQSSTKSTSSPLWEVHLHLQKSFASPLGRLLLTKFEAEDPGKFQDFVKFAEAIGLDPRTDIGEVALFGDGFEETDATVIANIGQTTGNLEGWVLAAPGYRSEDLDNNTLLHSITVEEKNARAYFAMPKHAPTGNYVLVGSLNQQRTVDLAQKVLAGAASPVPNPLSGSSLLKFYVNDLSAVPLDIDSNDPGSAIVKTVEQIGLNVASDPQHLKVALELSASSAGKARQISQLLTGLKAMIQLVPLEQPEAKQLATLLDSMVVNHTEGQPQVQASLSAPYQLLEDLVNEID